MKKVNLFLAVTMLALIAQSCTIDENGDFHLTWLFWFFLVLFILAVIFTSVSSGNEQKKTDAGLKVRGLKSADFKRTEATYVGGHPDVDRNVPYLVYRVSERKLLFYSRMADYQMPSFAFEIPADAIKAVEIEDASSIERKVTVGRMFLVGIFAFAWKKKKKNELAFITLDWNDGKFDHTTILNIEGKDAMQKANTVRNQLIRDIKSSTEKSITADENTKTGNKNPAIEELLNNMVRTGADAIVSIQMTKSEKIKILRTVIESFREHTKAPASYAKKLLEAAYQRMIANTESYDASTIENMKLDLSKLKVKSRIENSDFDLAMKYSFEYDKQTAPAAPAVRVAAYSSGGDGHLAFSIAGTKYRTPEEIARMLELKYAEELKLVPEPANPYDPDAIAVYTSDNCLTGYIPQAMTYLFRNSTGKLKKYRCIFTKASEYHPPFIYVRVDFPE